jgi:quercetin dioxygenase-like cupin family protein
MNILPSVLGAAALAVAAATSAPAQDVTPVPVTPVTGIERSLLQSLPVPGTAYETVLVLAQFAADATSGRHTHPGPASGFVIYGSLELAYVGEAPRLVRAGESFQIPADTVHQENALANGARVVAALAIPDREALSSPAE